MPRFSLRKLPENQRIQLIGEFYDAIHSLKSREEVRAFFRDLLNPDEITMLMRRIEIAALLCAGFTYDNIQNLTGAGKGTITAIQRKLQRENGGKGYRAVVSRLLDERKKHIQKQRKYRQIQESPLAKAKKKYPLQFLFFNILDEIAEREERTGKALVRAALMRTPSRRKPYGSMD